VQQLYSKSAPALLRRIHHRRKNIGRAEEAEDIQQHDDPEGDAKEPKNETAGHRWNSRVVAGE
jgi:hypothetical protein